DVSVGVARRLGGNDGVPPARILDRDAAPAPPGSRRAGAGAARRRLVARADGGAGALPGDGGERPPRAGPDAAVAPAGRGEVRAGAGGTRRLDRGARGVAGGGGRAGVARRAPFGCAGAS